MSSKNTVNLAGGSKAPPLNIILARLLWNAAWVLLFRPWPRRFGNRFRLALLRLFGAQIAPGVLICPDVRIMKPWELRVGSGTAIGSRVEIYNFCQVDIGEMVLISQDCYLCTGTHDYTDPKMPLVTSPITIEAESWLAAGVFVSPGVRVARGSVVAARSVVTKSTEPWMVCGGQPCRSIKPRVLRSPT